MSSNRAQRHVAHRCSTADCRDSPGHPASPTGPVTLGSGVLAAVLLLVAPGALVGRVAALPWPISITVGPALTYGIVGLAIIPFGAAGIPWNAATALVALAVVLIAAGISRVVLGRYRDRDAEARAPSGGQHWRRGPESLSEHC